MKRVIVASKKLGAFGARIGDTIIDTHTGKTGTVLKEGQSGNYSLIYVDFGGKNPVRINPLDDAQVSGRYQIDIPSKFANNMKVDSRIASVEYSPETEVATITCKDGYVSRYAVDPDGDPYYMAIDALRAISDHAYGHINF